MSDTPETDAAWRELRENNRVQPLLYLANKLERERDELRIMSVVEIMGENLNVKHHVTEWENRCLKAERERDEARIQYRSTLALAEALANTQIELKKERNEALAQMCQAVGYLSTIAEDCEAWLNNQCDETACEFIKAMRDYAKKGIDA
jgi:hypothetical protein